MYSSEILRTPSPPPPPPLPSQQQPKPSVIFVKNKKPNKTRLSTSPHRGGREECRDEYEREVRSYYKALGAKPQACVVSNARQWLVAPRIVLNDAMYIGGKGLLVLSTLLARNRCLTSLGLAHNGLTNESLVFFCRSLLFFVEERAAAPAKRAPSDGEDAREEEGDTLASLLEEIDLSGNALLGVAAGVALLSLAKHPAFFRLRVIKVEGTSIPPALQHKLKAILRGRQPRGQRGRDGITPAEESPITPLNVFLGQRKSTQLRQAGVSSSRADVGPASGRRPGRRPPPRERPTHHSSINSSQLPKEAQWARHETTSTNFLRNALEEIREAQGPYDPLRLPYADDNWCVVQVAIVVAPRLFASEVELLLTDTFPRLNRELHEYRLRMEPVVVDYTMLSEGQRGEAVEEDVVEDLLRSRLVTLVLVGDRTGDEDILFAQHPEVPEGEAKNERDVCSISALYRAHRIATTHSAFVMLATRQPTQTLQLPPALAPLYTNDPSLCLPDPFQPSGSPSGDLKEAQIRYYKDKHETLNFFKAFVQEDSTIPELHVLSYPALYDHVDERSGTVRLSHLELFREAVFQRLLILLTTSIAAGEAQMRDTHVEDFSGTRALEREVLKIYKQKVLDMLYQEGVSSAHLGELPFGPNDERAGQYVGTCAPVYRYLATLPFNRYSAEFTNMFVRHMVDYMVHPAAFYDFSRFDGTQRNILPPVVLVESLEPYTSSAHLFRLVTAASHPPPPPGPDVSALYAPEDVPHLLIAAHSTSSTVVREEPSDLRDVLVHLIQQFTEDPAVLAYVRQEVDIFALASFFRQLIATYEHEDVVCERPMTGDGVGQSRRSTPQSRFSDPPTKPVVLVILLDGIDAIEYPSVPCPALRYDATTGDDLWAPSNEGLTLPLRQQRQQQAEAQHRTSHNHLVLDSICATTASILPQNESDRQEGGMREEDGGHISTSLARKKALRKTTSLLEFVPAQLPLQVRFIATAQANSLAVKVLKNRGEDAVHVAALRELGDYELINSMRRPGTEAADGKVFAEDFDRVEQDKVNLFIHRLALLEITFSDEERLLVASKLSAAKSDEEYVYYMFYGLLREQERQWRHNSKSNSNTTKNNNTNRSMLFEESRNDLAELSYGEWLRNFPENSLAAAGMLHTALVAEFGAATVQQIVGILQVARWGVNLHDLRQIFPSFPIPDLNRFLRHLRPALEPANLFEHEVRLRENQLFANIRLSSRAFLLHVHRLQAMEGEGVEAARQRWHFLLTQHLLTISVYKAFPAVDMLSEADHASNPSATEAKLLRIARMHAATLIMMRTTVSASATERRGMKEITYHACHAGLWSIIDRIVLGFPFIMVVLRQGLLYHLVRDLIYAFNRRAEQLALQEPAGAAAQRHVPLLPPELLRMKQYILFLRDPRTRCMVENPFLVMQLAVEARDRYNIVCRDAHMWRSLVQGGQLRSPLLANQVTQSGSPDECVRRLLLRVPYQGYLEPVATGASMPFHFRAVTDVRFFANNRYVVTVGADRAMTWFRTGTSSDGSREGEGSRAGEQGGGGAESSRSSLLRFTMRQPTSAIEQVLVSPTCNYVVAIAENRIIYIYDGETAQLVGHCGVWSKTEEGPHAGQEEDRNTGHPARSGEQLANIFTAPIADVQFSSRGRYLFVFTKDAKLYVFRTEKGVLLDVLTAEDLIPSMADAVDFVQHDEVRTVAEKEELLRNVWRDFYAVDHHLHVLPQVAGGEEEEEEVFYTFTDEMMSGWRLQIDEMVPPAAGDPSTVQGHTWRERTDRIYAMAYHTASATGTSSSTGTATGGALRAAIETRMKYSAWRATCWLQHSLAGPLLAVRWYPAPVKSAHTPYKLHRPPFLLLTPLELPFAQLLHLHEGAAWCTFSWEPHTWQRVSAVAPPVSQVREVQLCPRGKVLAASFADGRILLYTVCISSILSFHVSRRAASKNEDDVDVFNETLRPPLVVFPFARINGFSLCDDPFISHLRFFSFELQATSLDASEPAQQNGRSPRAVKSAKLGLLAVGNSRLLRYWDVSALLPQGAEEEEEEGELEDGTALDDAWHTVKENADGEYVSAKPICSWDASSRAQCVHLGDVMRISEEEERHRIAAWHSPASDPAAQDPLQHQQQQAQSQAQSNKKVDVVLGDEAGNVTFLQFV